MNEDASQNTSSHFPDVDITESVHDFAGTKGEYYTEEFKRVQKSSSGYCWTFNLGAAAFGPLWATARGLWGLFWVFSVLELVVIVMIGQGLWGDLGSDKFARAERLQTNYERMLERVETAKQSGDEEGVESFQKRAETLAKARDKVIAEGELARAGKTRLLIVGIVLLVLVKLFEGLSANIAYERQYTTWRTDSTVRAGFNWMGGLLGLAIVGFVYNSHTDTFYFR